MAGEYFDFFAHRELPTPTLDPGEVRRLVSETWALDCHLTELGSQQDQNFLMSEGPGAAPIGVLKLSNPVFSGAEIELQDLAAATVAGHDPTIRVPRIVAGPTGPMSAWWDTSQGRLQARVIEFFDGATLMGSGYLAPRVVARVSGRA